MSTATATPEPPAERQVYLRVKRKREDEPATHMVAEVILPGSKKPRGVFTYKGTEEDSDMFDNPEYVPKWLATHPILPGSSKSGSSTSLPIKSNAPPSESTPITEDPKPPSPTKAAPGGKSYTIVPRPSVALPSPHKANMPPVVRPKAALQAESSTKAPIVTFYDAIEALRADEGGDEVDPEMSSFASMVDDYLQLNDISLDDTNHIARSEPAVDRLPFSEPHDYVYDIFQLNVKDAERVQELLESGNAGSVATVTGLPYWELTLGALVDDGSDDSVKDEADEDSNDEDFYRNDYPDQEEEVSDEDEDEFQERGKYFEARHSIGGMY
ncbi:hypothetical protein FRB96_001744 [Tulasnella sp. 330]|nr:hypothetical protein FRB96_001744 [Tulasnella sp. 330]KAG8881520.1 hypothetical protein FRB97_009447 [Tulasnella sp. 331]KAG8885836.1 hypothetical protein FRB98_001582 [Tulasnella sp. 332]